VIVASRSIPKELDLQTDSGKLSQFYVLLTCVKGAFYSRFVTVSEA